MPDSSGSPGLDILRRQLWAATEAAGSSRLVPGRPGRTGEPDEGWETRERYWAVPSLARLRLLVPAGDPHVTAAALDGYRRLRPSRERAVRRALGVAARAGLPPGAARVDLQVRRGAHPELPLTVIAGALDDETLVAAIGVRPGPNGKPTLQLLDGEGRHRGYAKLGWNAHTDAYVATETSVLTELEGGGSGMRVPRALAAGTVAGHPWVVTEPLPEGARALRGRDDTVTSTELMALTPVVRRDTPAGTQQLGGVLARLRGLDGAGPTDLVDTVASLARSVAAVELELPVVARWHGDLTPWNCARDEAGGLWCWDWETCEPDALAGLDALHWALSVRRERAGGIAGVALADCVADARHHLRAAGVGARADGAVAGAYALTVAERALTLAARSGWERAWISPAEVSRVVDEGRRLLGP
ncbi:MAG: hypothetical protein U0R80_16535 [Nocardioidaceae bacterium]